MGLEWLGNKAYAAWIHLSIIKYVAIVSDPDYPSPVQVYERLVGSSFNLHSKVPLDLTCPVRHVVPVCIGVILCSVQM